ncbi:PepSY domain-containing protein [Sphingomonas sp.]|uniref:PepSY domain-containing protein n=1 Tax=Sphingomonas sp. TaxID=28214 RepID=UPI00286A0672|nr:PepSY domain-containing protein [Sphingomonas sp.]
MGAVRSRLRRWHVWLGWIVGLPILLWVVTGLVMVAKPIEEVRGEGLLSEPKPMRMATPPAIPRIDGVAIKGLTLERRAAGIRWVVTLPDGSTRLADPANGAMLPPLSAADAVREVTARYMGAAKVQSATRTDPKSPPMELRRPIAAWRVAMDDGTHFYVDGGSGAIVARRTGWWRFYDLMWGIHIMDLKTREDAHNPLTIGFAIVALALSILALIQLPLTIRRRRQRKEPST